MPTTRSGAGIASSSKATNDADPPLSPLSQLDSSSHEDSHDDDDVPLDNLEGDIANVQIGIKGLRKEITQLKKENKRLKGELERLNEAEDVSIQPKRGKKGGPSVASLQGEVKRLKGEVESLEKVRAKAKKAIRKLERREAKREAADLMDEGGDNVEDTPYQMRKLLRRFQDLMMENVLEDSGQDCPVCLEPMALEKCSSFPCQHLICDDCLPSLAPGQELTPCPNCRRECTRDEIDSVTRTATQQWDALQEVAISWAKIDKRNEMDTSEEEAEEEPFIDDGEAEAGSPAPSAAPHDSTPEPEPDARDADSGNPPTTPPPRSVVRYSETPASLKRKRMQELAEQRMHKRSR
ncbi:hypothetical protein JAAARDRAFT_201618 [Jaapia argillacea MUCL 33604]|uniref:RING-type domain-containing protein n=1 Tax=Jaapia argillacea MUCL 33604 TaxID=933084 RepID=A0A067QB06_9AGAM|nr:hypothetical protein JAAARDRAFT_201618 [Jaapia argillacea MUCL 33604]